MTLTLLALTARLEAALAAPLPGDRARAALRPEPPVVQGPKGPPRPAAALALLYDTGAGATLLLTERSLSLPHHAGQISLPGGLVEPGETMEEAARREAREEAGVDPEGIEILGRLTPLHIPVSGFLLHPVVARAVSRPAFRPHAPEVTRLLEVPWEELAAPRALQAEPRLLGGVERRVPYFAVGGVKVWGATAMVLAELLWLGGAPVRSDERGRPGP